MPPFSKKKRRSRYHALLHEEDSSKKLTYVNITITDASEGVYKMVHSKVSETHKNFIGTKKFKEKVAHTVARTASNSVPKKEIVKKLAGKVPKMLMYQMHHKMGMRIAAQNVYREDNYAVFQIQVQYVDSKRMLATAKEEMRSSQSENATKSEEEEMDDDDSVATAVLDEWIAEQKNLVQEEQESAFVTEALNEEEENQLNWYNWRELFVLFLTWLLHKLMPVTITRNLEENRLPALIQSQISSKLKEMLDKKLKSKSMKAETAVLGEEEQARYFFAQLQKIRTPKGEAEGET
ncbi:expressed unknown protein [Seminavis robusta]|uniref:Uncharacterized protein n=1 Tax=Seminavis robusta TaxID=568900 RepID=A0A9N8HT40_9STRA|nr:expressed unknown protein [Seminavis robusta]|eukprot:Sro1608_g285690.1 n/a (293) ;mRNA; f:16290-17168